jgi:rRNA biogenesis protein RRP5
MVDGIYYLSLEKSVIDRSYLRLEDIPVGQMLTVIIERMIEHGLIVRVTDDIIGLVPRPHLIDAAVDQSLYKHGMKLQARVLNVDHDRHRVAFTVKQPLFDSRLPLIQSLTPDLVGTRTKGVLLHVTEKGSSIEFFGGVRAYLPAREMSESFFDDAK